jgi:uncharacterized protein (DUF58 family)
MPVAIALIFVVVVLAVLLIGILWAIAFLLPFYAFIAVAAFLVWRGKQSDAEAAALVERDAERQRLFNEQETNAWRSSLEKDRRNTSEREKTLRSFDRNCDPSKK